MFKKALSQGIYPASTLFPRAVLKLWRDFTGERPYFVFHSLPQKLEPDHLEVPRLFAHRDAMLDWLPKGGVVAEVGTYKGEFARRILDTCEPRKLYLLDVTFNLVPPGLVDDPSVERREGDSADLLSEFPDDHFDWLYIDGDHSVRGASRDAEAARRKVKPGGLLAFNDYTIFDPLGMKPLGVVHAVNRLCVEHGFKVVGFALHPSGFQDIVLKKPL